MSDKETKDVQETVGEASQTDSITAEQAEQEEPSTKIEIEASNVETITEEVNEESAEKKEPEAAYHSKLVDFTQLKPGMTVRVHERIKDISPKGEERERIQIFEGIILWLKSSGISRTITVRKISKGFGVEKIYPINSPVIAKIELVKKANVCRAKLGYLKDLKHRFKRKLKETRPQ